MSTFHTQRLLLRPIRVDDWPAKSVIDQQPEVYQYQGFILQSDGSKRGRTPEEVRRRLEMRVAEFDLQGLGQWVVILKETGEMIGWVGLQFYLLDHGPYNTPEVELFYGLSPAYWGQGFITEACQELVRYGFMDLKLRRITSCAFRENIRSVNVIRRVGMHISDHPSDKASILGILENPHLVGQHLEGVENSLTE